MPPLAIGALGAGLAGSAIAGGVGAAGAQRQAARARRGAQATFEEAQRFRPDIYQPTTSSQARLLSALQQQALAPAAQIQPEFFTPEQEEAAAEVLARRAGEVTERGRQATVASSARRGLFRSGIGAEQEREFVAQRAQSLDEALLQQQLQFQQQRAAEAQAVFGLNQQALAQRGALLGQAGGAQRAQLAQQQDLFRALLGFAGAQAGAAGQTQAAASQATAQALQAPFSFLGQAGLLGAMGGFGGGGTPAILQPGMGGLLSLDPVTAF